MENEQINKGDVKPKIVDEKFVRFSKYLSWVSTTIAAVGLALIVGLFTDSFFSTNETKINDNNFYKINEYRNIPELETEVKKLDTKINSFILKILSEDSLNQINSGGIELTLLKLKISELEINQRKLGEVILDNPEKAISILLLKQQIDNLKTENDKDQKSIKDEIARVYDMNKWIIGLVFTMLVSIIVLNISNLFIKNKKD